MMTGFLLQAYIHTIDAIDIAFKEDSTFIGFATMDSSHKKVKCIFKEGPAGGHIFMNQYNFSYKSKYRNFPVSLSACVLFADSSATTGKKINVALFKQYDLIGQNYSAVINKLSFANLAKYKHVKDYKRYCINKFITVYKNIITDRFLEDAKESGHTDIYLNSLTSEVIWNDGNYLAIQVIMDYADGNAYPYYDTFIFEYDLKNDNVIMPDILNKHIRTNDKSIQAVIDNLQKTNIYDASEWGDKWFLSLPQIAFAVKDGVVLYRTGGNHSIHYFYKYYPREALAPILE